MINETVKKLNRESNSHNFKRNTVSIKDEWFIDTFDVGKDRKTLSVRWVSPFEEHIPTNFTAVDYPQKITGDIIRKKLSSPPKPTPEEFTVVDMGPRC